MYNWRIVPLCKNQLRDVSETDILNSGLYRKCNTYHSGGGYDQLPLILEKRGMVVSDKQFVVQLEGCPFRCPYCYVTPDGIFGGAVKVDTRKLVKDFKSSQQDIFHLMGGAPALYIQHWGELINLLKQQDCKVFHSDILLVECDFTDEIMQTIKDEIAVYAVSIKGWDEDSYKNNTGCNVNVDRMRKNLKQLSKNNVNYYVTFTGLSDHEVQMAVDWLQLTESQLEDSFIIGLKQYKALE